ncbi:dynein light chain Tctex-type 5-like [Helicoverpa zea]|uniref:dynein light chain Tctex-type 5-like n=1 Tax=Helicoverpa zea TaxID=7113 RepID=UPI001F5AD832|nr:dynein light chain Tctex-type 5-like [Helicoverpa zea]
MEKNEEDTKSDGKKVGLVGVKSATQNSVKSAANVGTGKSMSRMKVRRQSYGFSGAVTGVQQHKYSALATEFKRPPLIFQNTYQTEPTVRFHVPSVKKCMNEVLDKQFTGHVYNASVSPGLTIIIAGEIMRSVKKLGFNRYRIISVVTIAQKRSQSYHNAVSFLWDHERDGIVNTQRELHTAFIQATVFGVYLD